MNILAGKWPLSVDWKGLKEAFKEDPDTQENIERQGLQNAIKTIENERKQRKEGNKA